MSVEVPAALGLRPIAKPGGDDHFAHGNMRNWRIVRLRTLQVTRQGEQMITLGLILLIIGFIAKIAILWVIGIVLLVIGLILILLGSIGRAVGGRRHYY
jgi:hypothetical protein